MAMNRIDHATIRVGDLGESLAWYRDVLGLTVLEQNASRVALACRGEAADVTLHVGGQGLENFAFGVDSADDLDRAEASLSAYSVSSERLRHSDRPGASELLCFTLPSGHAMELVVGDNRRAGVTEIKSDGTYRPSDLDHVNLLGTVAPEELSMFMRDVLGFKQSLALKMGGSWVGSWLRSTRLDHDIAYMKAVRQNDRLHHIAFAMEDGNHYFRLGDRLADTGHRFEFGPGRHMGRERCTSGFGTNWFAYVFDPTGNRNEFSGGMDEMEDNESLVTELTPDRVGHHMNGWAHNMPDSFMTIGT